MIASWLHELSHHHAIAYAIVLIAIVIAGGLAAGSVKFRGIGLGGSGVLFVGIMLGHIAPPPTPDVLDFAKEFGLVLFVFALGLQLGPGFVASLRAEGLRLNLLAAAVVLIGSLLALLAIWLLPIAPSGVLGALSGAVTNTPSLGVTQQALKDLPDAGTTIGDLPAIAYAIAYPGGVLGIIVSLLLLRWWLRIDLVSETTACAQEMTRSHPPLERRTLRVDNPLIDGVLASHIPGLQGSGVTVSRHRDHRNSDIHPVTATTVVHLGDRLLAVGPGDALDRLQPTIGKRVEEDMTGQSEGTAYSRIMVTASGATGQHLGALRLGERFGVYVTRVLRSGTEMSPENRLRLHFGDVLHVVGGLAALNQAAALVGNQPKELNQTHFASLFLGIALGVVVGLVPIALPGLPQPVRLGLAGGPLLIAILLGWYGSFGRLVWHIPEVVNRSFRELGISLFLAGVGLTAGPVFFATVGTSDGILWAVIGVAITMIPLLLIGWFSLAVLRMNFLRTSGLLAGSMTDPPALAFANRISGGEWPSTAYATVYPLTMLLRIVVAQALVAWCYA